MAGQAGKWRYGLLPLAALWVGVNTLETPRIEADLKARAQRALEVLGSVGAHPHVEGRDVTLKSETAESPRVAPAPEKPAPTAKAEPEAPPPAKTIAPQPAEKKPPAEEAHVRAVAAPYLFHVEKSAGKLALSGFYPDEDAHAKILAEATKAFPGRDLVDRLKPAAGAPSGFVEAALAGLAQLARLRSGALDLHDRALRLTGEAATAETADESRARLESVQLAGYSVNVQVAGPPVRVAAAPPPVVVRPARLDPRACQAEMAELVKEAPIVFRLGSALLDPVSARTLDAVAEVAKRCPDVDLEIAGHTDDIGYISENLELSRRRAESVLVYLVAVGVAPQRLTAVGYGETRPLVANVNDDNRARNRRIEFNLK